MSIDEIDPRRRKRADGGSAPRQAWRGSPNKAASNLGSREVIVRVTGRTKSLQSLGRQFVYNTRKGHLDAEHSSGRVLRGTADLREMRDRWAEENAVLARHPSCPTQSLGVVLSMPVGTSPAAVRVAAVAWAHEHLTRSTEWLATVHLDKAHPHTHVAVRAVQNDGRRVSASPSEVQQWRESFAGSLQAMGIEAHATPQREKLERLLAQERAVRDQRTERPIPALPSLDF